MCMPGQLISTIAGYVRAVPGTVNALSPLNDSDMNSRKYKSRKWLNFIHSFLILAGMALILCVLGWLVAGKAGIFWSLFIGLIVMIITSGIPPQAVLNMHNARRLGFDQTPKLYQIINQLSKRAGLSFSPKLFYIPSRGINAFSVGQRENAAIALTDGMLRSLNYREILGVLAHEISHIRNNDIWIMNLAEAAGKVTSLLSLTGQLLLLINLPLILMEEYHISWWIIAVLIFAPTLSTVMQLALSRTREFEADMDAAMLTNDPVGLAQALHKLENPPVSWLDKVVGRKRKSRVPSILLTHPRTEDRIERLIQMARDTEDQDYDHSFPVLPEDFVSVRLRMRPLKRLLRKWF